jgi:hypothetical protein
MPQSAGFGVPIALDRTLSLDLTNALAEVLPNPF